MMRMFGFLGAIFLAILSVPSLAQEGQGQRAREEAFRTVRNDYYSAFYRGDTDSMAKAEAKNLTVIHDRTPNAQPGEDWRRDIRKLVEAKKWNPKRMVGETVNQTVRFNGSVATVGGMGLMETTIPKGQSEEYKAFTEIWKEEDGRWRLVHLHYDFRPPGDREAKKK